MIYLLAMQPDGVLYLWDQYPDMQTCFAAVGQLFVPEVFFGCFTAY